MITVGGFLANCSRRCWPPRMADEFLVDDLDDLLRRVQRAADLVAERTLADLRGELLDDHERDVGVEQRAPDLADGAVHVRGRELALGAEVAEGLSEPVGEGAESRHDPPILREGRPVARSRAP